MEDLHAAADEPGRELGESDTNWYCNCDTTIFTPGRRPTTDASGKADASPEVDFSDAAASPIHILGIHKHLAASKIEHSTNSCITDSRYTFCITGSRYTFADEKFRFWTTDSV